MTSAPELPSGVVTFLLTDVQGSTQLWQEAPEAMATALTRHDAIIRAAVATARGSLLKARGEGDSTFTVFARATDAVAAARVAQLGLSAEPWPTPTPMLVRMAIHTGEVLERDGDYYGQSVNRAARLRSLAAGGQVLVSGVTAELVRDHLREGTTLVDMGSHELRDLVRPETVYELSFSPVAPVASSPRASSPSERVPLPVRLVATPLSGFHGRRTELSLLGNRAAEAATGSRRLVLVAGEPGIGKTALAAEHSRTAHDGGAVVLYGRCDEDLGLPYQCWAEALEHLASHAPAHLGEHLGPRRTADLARLVPSLIDPTGPASGADPESQRYHLFAAVVAALQATAALGPVVIVLDDLHWADTPSLSLLRHVVGSSEPLALLIIGTYRHNELSVNHPLADTLAALRREQGVERVVMAGLSDTELVAVVEAVAGQRLEGAELALGRALYRETDGNPFFAWEMLTHLAESGAVNLDDDGRWVVRADVDERAMPDSVREVIGRRVARLGPEVHRALVMAAVIGRDFDLDVLVAALDGDPDVTVDALDRAEAALLVSSVAPGRFTFVHALVLEALYADLTPTRRARAHQRVAEAIERLGGAERRVAELARHWAAATVTAEADKAIGYARRAGDQALGALAPQEAVRLYAQALELLAGQATPDDSERCSLLIGLGDAQRQAGLPEHRDTLLEAATLARRLGDGPRLVAAALAWDRGVGQMSAVDSDHLGVIEAALEAVGEGDSAARARLLAALAGQVEPLDWARRRDLALEAVSVARRVGDEATLLAVLTGTFLSRSQPDSLDGRAADTEEALALADRMADPVGRFQARYWRCFVCADRGDLAELDQRFAEMAVLAAEIDQPFLWHQNAMLRCARLLLAGGTAEAEAAAEETLEIASRIGVPEAVVEYGANLSQIRRDQGRLAELADLMGEVATDAPSIPVFRAALTGAYLEAGRFEDAAALLALDLADGFAYPYDLMWLLGMVMCADNVADLGHRDAAAVLYERLAPFADKTASAGAMVHLGAVGRTLGRLAALLGDDAAAEAHFVRALAINERLEAPYWIARTQLDYAELLLARRRDGDVRTAVGLAEAARRTADTRGYAGLQERAIVMLDRIQTAES